MTVLAATTSIMTLGFAFSGSAWAGTNGRAWSVKWEYLADGACDLQFVSYGDHFYLNDNLKDGAGCYASWDDDAGHAGTFTNTKGAGTTVHRNYDFPEGAFIRFKVCVTDNGVLWVDTCGSDSATA